MKVEYKNIDPKLVVNEIRNGRSLEAVQKLFGIKFKSEVQDLYLRGLMELGEIPQVDFNKQEKQAEAQPRPVQPAAAVSKTSPTVSSSSSSSPGQPKTVIRRREKTAKPSVFIRTPNLRTIGQSGSITLNKALLIELLGFAVGDSFEICREDDRIVLNKISHIE